ncbi:MAG: helix-turn-helix domain-containing protein [Alphaproteobacteria bacterium]|nr:MAG: helix-turn-helix domain-containing protein [Alphaproteobacteria bacterium]
MDALLSKSCGIAAAQRGQIVQRVLVDGWSTAQAAATFGLQERRVARWVADYRRDGMASLREDDAGELLWQRWIRRLRGAVARCYGGVRRGFGLVEPAPCIELRRTGDKRGGGN